MYNLFRFILRYYLFLSFILLEGFCFFLIYRSSRYHEAAYTRTATNISGKAQQTYRGAVDYFYLRKYNDSLAAENAALRARLMESKVDMRIDSGSVSDSAKRFIQHYTYISARVVKNSVNKVTNILYLDKGKNQGIDKQMGVIASTGIVGQVIHVTDNYAVVMSVLSKNFGVGVKFKKNEYFGNLNWEGINSTMATLEQIPKHVPAQVGDTIVTSGFSQLFPRGIMVGIVKSVKSAPEKPFLDITVNLSTDFGNLNYVYVVNNMRREEVQLLDSLYNPQPK